DPATFSGIVSINLTTGALAITDAVTIKGTGSDSLTVNAGGTSRVFDTSGAPSASAITISGMTMSGGKATVGGAVFVDDEALTLSDCIITGSSVTVRGGGIYLKSAASSLTLQGCTVQNNTANGPPTNQAMTTYGGGICIIGASAVTIQGSTI